MTPDVGCCQPAPLPPEKSAIEVLAKLNRLALHLAAPTSGEPEVPLPTGAKPREVLDATFTHLQVSRRCCSTHPSTGKRKKTDAKYAIEAQQREL